MGQSARRKKVILGLSLLLAVALLVVAVVVSYSRADPYATVTTTRPTV